MTSVDLWMHDAAGTVRLRDGFRPSGSNATTDPAGALAISAVVASADDGNVAANTIDNNLSTRWSADGDGQWIRFDLGSSQTVGSVQVAWYKGDTRRSTFDVELSGDATAWTRVYSGSSSGTTTAREPYGFPDAAARYVRIVGHGNTANSWNSITEVEIIGADAASSPPATPNANATGTDGAVTLDGSAGSGPTPASWTWRRSTAAGGPYSDLTRATGLASPAHIDTTVTNGTTYYYVLAATNADGTTVSAEKSATPAANSALGIAYTDAELALWQKRATDGYHGWAAIKAEADWFRASAANRASCRWSPPNPHPWSSHVDCPPISGGHTHYTNRMHKAAFFARVKDDQPLGRLVIDNLLAQARTTNASMWGKAPVRHDLHPGYLIGNHVGLCVRSLDWTWKWATNAEIIEILDWAQGIYDVQADVWKWPGDKMDTGSGRGANAKDAGEKHPSYGTIQVHSTGTYVSRISYDYENRQTETAKGLLTTAVSRIFHRTRGLTFSRGTQAQDELWRTRMGRDWPMEWIKFQVIPDASFMEYRRWDASPPRGWKAWQYVAGAVAGIYDLADLYVRSTGDYAPLTFTTSDGTTNSGAKSSGTPTGYTGKSLRYAIDAILLSSADTHADKIVRYASASPYRIDHEAPNDGTPRYNREVYMCLANVYYRNARIKDATMRRNGWEPYFTSTGDEPPEWFNSEGHASWHPGVVFQYREADGVVKPY